MWAGVLGPYQVSWLLPISASIRSIDDVRPATPIMALSLRVARAARAWRFRSLLPPVPPRPRVLRTVSLWRCQKPMRAYGLSSSTVS
jgi:hypothetical protein